RVDVDAPLPANRKVGLARKIEVGQLEIEPLGVESRKLVIVEEPKSGKPTRTERPNPALVLTLRVKNTSPDLAIYPLDPAFNRKTVADKIGTQLVVGKQSYRGGPIPWPFDRVKRAYEEKQETEATPLKPGETRDYVVCADPDSGSLKAVKESNEL